MTEHGQYIQRRWLTLLCMISFGCESAPVRPQPAEQATVTAVPVERHAAGLRYLEVVSGAPDVARTHDTLPLVVFLHGRGDRAHTHWIDGFSARARFVFPEAPAPYGNGFSWFPFSVAESDAEQLARSIATSTSQLVRALDEITQARATRGKPIVAGFSQGAILTYALAAQHPDAIAFGLPVAGMLPEPMLRELPRAGVRYPPLRALHGRADPVIPFGPTERMLKAWQADGLDVQLQTFENAGHELNSAMRAALFAGLREALAANARAQ